MSPEKEIRLRAIGTDPAISWAASLSWLAKETDRYLDRLARSVAECKSVDEAANFCRWLQFSGVMKLPHPDCKELRGKTEDIMHRVGEIYKGGKVKPAYAASDIEAINLKLDYLLSNNSQAKKQTEIVVDVPSFTATRVMLPAPTP